jgi:hypothetical protein
MEVVTAPRMDTIPLSMAPTTMPIHNKPITMDTLKPGDTWDGMSTATEDPADTVNAANTRAVATTNTLVIHFASVT